MYVCAPCTLKHVYVNHNLVERIENDQIVIGKQMKRYYKTKPKRTEIVRFILLCVMHFLCVLDIKSER